LKYSKRIICAGNGLAALNLALHLADDTELLILAAADFSASNSYLAKGGIAIPLQEEDAERHIQDTLTAGDGLCDEAVVRELIHEAPAVVNMLQRFGLNFDASLSREGGHSCARIHHVADETGTARCNSIASTRST
jgi:L-aspartate oxidase